MKHNAVADPAPFGEELVRPGLCKYLCLNALDGMPTPGPDVPNTNTTAMFVGGSISSYDSSPESPAVSTVTGKVPCLSLHHSIHLQI